MESDMKETNKWKKIKRIATTVLTTVFFIFAIVILIMGTSSIKNGKMLKIFGHSYSVVVTDSMVPTINVNDIIIIDYTDIKEIKEKDIIVYHNDEKNINIVHRVIGFDENGDLITKGDNNNENDKIHINSTNYIGKVVDYGNYLGIGKLVVNGRNYIFLFIILIFIYIIISETIEIIKTAKLIQQKEIEEKNEINHNESEKIDYDKLREEMKKELMEEMKQKQNK